MIHTYKFPKDACTIANTQFDPKEAEAKIINAAKNTNARIQTNKIYNQIRIIEVRCKTEDQLFYMTLSTAGLFGVECTSRKF